MKKRLSLCFIVISSALAHGQTPGKFDIPLSYSTNAKSIYYYKTVLEKLTRLDTTITAEQIISATKYAISKKKFSPSHLDSLADKTYKLNEAKKYNEAIAVGRQLLNLSPNNITGHKELAFAYKRLGNENLSDKYFQLMIKIITSVFRYGDGTYDTPFLINNYFEGISIYEAAFHTRPKKMVVMLSKDNRILGAYNGYSSAMDEVLIRYSELSHWKPSLKREDYIVEGK